MRAKFIDLARALGEFGVWVRLHYVYPYPHVDEVIALMADGKVLPYLDVPFQHASPAVLKRMRRPAAQEQTLARIRRVARRLRRVSPSARPSSSAFPARPKRIFRCLLDWLGEAELDRVGCFRYEPVAGAAANDLGAPVPEEVKNERYQRLMARQQEISGKRLKRQIGNRERGHHRRGRRKAGSAPRHRQGPQQRRRAADRRHGLRCEPPSIARRRDRNREDRARRRL